MLFFIILGIKLLSICNWSSFNTMYLLPVKTEMHFHDRCEKNNVQEIADLLQY